MSGSIDVTTHQIAEEVASYLQKNPHKPIGKIKMNLTVEDILNVWYAIGEFYAYCKFLIPHY